MVPTPMLVCSVCGEVWRHAQAKSQARACPRCGATTARPAANAAPPGYEIDSILGRGGTATVYRARDLKRQRVVALKMISAGVPATMVILERFSRGSAAAARLQHPNIVQLLDVGEHRGLPYCALEYVPGGSLEQHLAGGALEARAAARLIEVLARAVEASHAAGIIHCDLKPGNILLSKDARKGPADASPDSWGPKITDFALAKIGDDVGPVVPGRSGGTPAYVAPEQALGHRQRIGPATDVYALGTILYEALTGRRVVKAPSVEEALDAVCVKEPVPPRSLQEAVPVELETICLKCLEKDPRQRYASAQALAEDLRRFLAGEPIEAQPRTATVAARLAAEGARVLAESCDGRLLVTAARGGGLHQPVGTALVHDARTGAEVVALRGHQEMVTAAAFSADSSRLLTGGADGVVKLWTVDGGQESGSWQEGGSWQAYAAGAVTALAFARDTQTFASGGGTPHGGDRAGDVSPLGPGPAEAGVVASGAASAVKIWDGQAPQAQTEIPTPGAVLCLAFAGDGRTLAFAAEGADPVVWDVAAGQARATLQGHRGSVTALCLSRDGKLAASAGKEGAIKLWDALSGRLRATLPRNAGPVSFLTFSRDQQSLATGNGSGKFTVWNFAGTLDGFLACIEEIQPDLIRYRRPLKSTAWTRRTLALDPACRVSAARTETRTGKYLPAEEAPEGLGSPLLFLAPGEELHGRILTDLQEKTVLGIRLEARSFSAVLTKVVGDMISLRRGDPATFEGTLNAQGCQVVLERSDGKTAGAKIRESAKEGLAHPVFQDLARGPIPVYVITDPQCETVLAIRLSDRRP